MMHQPLTAPHVADRDMSNNTIGGSLPSGWSALSQLQVINLDGNQLTGAFPASIKGHEDETHAYGTCTETTHKSYWQLHLHVHVHWIPLKSKDASA